MKFSIQKNTIIQCTILGYTIPNIYCQNGKVINIENNWPFDDELPRQKLVDGINKYLWNRCDYSGVISGIITIKRNSKYQYADIWSQIETQIHDLLNDKGCSDLILAIDPLSIQGNEDLFDDQNNCLACKYFQDFYKIPTLKVNKDIEDISVIYKQWDNLYYNCGVDIYDNNVAFISRISATAFGTPIEVKSVVAKRGNSGEKQYFVQQGSTLICIDENTLLNKNIKIGSNKSHYIYKFNDRIVAHNVLSLFSEYET